MKTLLVPVFVILGLVSAAIPLSAHHSWPVSYSQQVTVKGTVMAGYKILTTILRVRLESSGHPAAPCVKAQKIHA